MSTEPVFKTHCLKCGHDFAAPVSRAGQPILCPHCQREVALPAEPLASAIIAPTRAPILILPNAKPIHVEMPTIVLVLAGVGWLQIILAVAVLFISGLPAAVMTVGSGIVTLAFGKLIECAHGTAQRLARLELFFQTVVNERR